MCPLRWCETQLRLTEPFSERSPILIKVIQSSMITEPSEMSLIRRVFGMNSEPMVPNFLVVAMSIRRVLQALRMAEVWAT